MFLKLITIFLVVFMIHKTTSKHYRPQQTVPIYGQAVSEPGPIPAGSNYPQQTGESQEAAETGFESGNLDGHGKYFQYAQVPAKDHYEFGYRKGNDHHFREHHEKAHPHAGEFKTKVRWGDKHGGYGEHYWDYNHAGDEHHDGEESKTVNEYEPYQLEGSEVNGVVVRPKRNRDEEIFQVKPPDFFTRLQNSSL